MIDVLLRLVSVGLFIGSLMMILGLEQISSSELGDTLSILYQSPFMRFIVWLGFVVALYFIIKIMRNFCVKLKKLDKAGKSKN
ncbi:hypothetical protein ACPFMY_000426 [Vibrio cholerae]